MKNLNIIDHPVMNHKLNTMRQKETTSEDFRRLAREVSRLLAFEVTKTISVEEKVIETPLSPMTAKFIVDNSLAIVSILRAGNGILDGFLDVVPMAGVGHIGLERDAETLEAKQYYYKVPNKMSQRFVILVDPMLATGNSAIAALDKIMQENPKRVCFVSLLAAPEGVKKIHDKYPEVEIYSASLDERLNEKSYIVPGLGDAGDRIYNT